MDYFPPFAWLTLQALLLHHACTASFPDPDAPGLRLPRWKGAVALSAIFAVEDAILCWGRFFEPLFRCLAEGLALAS